MSRRLALAAAAFVALTTLLSTLGTPAAGATVPPWFSDTLVVNGFSSPRSLDFFPDGRILVVENDGRFVLVNGTTASDMATLSPIETGGEQGLLGVAIDPGFPSRPYAYVHYTSDRNPTSYVRISRFNFTNASGPGPLGIDLGSELILLGDIPNINTNHNGGTVRFGPDGMLYVSIGDDAQGSGCPAQNLSFMGGKILRLKVDDTVNPNDRSTLAPSDNPFFGDPRVNATLVWAYGLRNPFRFDIDPVTGTLYIGDVGQNAWEEIDRVPTGGANLGWPYYEANSTYRGTLCPTDSSMPTNLTFPIYQFPNSGSAIILGTVYRGVDYPNDASFPPEYDQNLFYVDFYEDPLHVLRSPNNLANWSLVAGNDAVNWANGMQWTADIQEGPDGAVYWVSEAGELRRIGYDSVPQITTASVAVGTVGVGYSAQLNATGSPTPFAWSIASGLLPQGLTIEAATGIISGSPTTVETASFVVQVNTSAGRSGIRPFTIQIADPVSIAPATLPDAIEGASYSGPFAAMGGVAPFTWAIVSGVLPDGLALSTTVGHVTGIATQFGDFSFEVGVTDSQGRATVQAVTLHVHQALAFASNTLPDGVEAAYYETTLSAVGGVPPYSCAVNASSTLPTGLQFAALNATLYGVPAAAAAVILEFDVQDSGGQVTTASFSLVIAPPSGGPPLITTTSLPDATAGVNYDVLFDAVEGNPPLQWSIETVALPPGISFAAGNARLHGSPVVPGTYSFNVTVTDSSARAATRLFTLRVLAEVHAIHITTTTLPAGEVGIDYGSVSLAYAGENLSTNVAWHTASALGGLVLDVDGTLHGTPTADGIFAVSVTVSDLTNVGTNATATFDLVITRVSITTPSIPQFTAGVGVIIIFAADAGGTVVWSVENGALPPGVTLSANGTLQGTPTVAGNYTVTIRAAREGATGTNFDDQVLTFEVAPSGSPPPPPPPPPAPSPPPPASPPSYGFPMATLLVVALLGAGVLLFALSRRRKKSE